VVESYEFVAKMKNGNTLNTEGRLGKACFCLPFAIWFGLIFTSTAAQEPPGYNLRIDVEQLAPVQGTLHVALFDRADKFMKKHTAIIATKVTAPKLSLVFSNLPAGEYAFSIFHDVNDNGKLDTNLLGVPIEPWGFSNDARGRFGPPAFHQARFVLMGSRTITLTLNR
jgi:uncharacterized protein (DUF2141 family)